ILLLIVAGDWSKMKILWTVVLFVSLASSIDTNSVDVVRKDIDDSWFPVNIIHINDFHARFEEITPQSNTCNPETTTCVGGYARVVTKVKELLEVNRDNNPLYLNAGDNFQGTLWYNIGRWNVTVQFLNMLKADAMTIGNHEFDHDIEGVVPFLEQIESPVVIANVEDSQEPTFQGKYTKSVVIDKYDRKIGIIGAILRTTNNIAKTGQLAFTNEAQAVREEAERLKAEGVDIIIVLSHCGLDRDREIANFGGPNIDLIVGGHSHSFLWSGDDLPSVDRPADSYPVEVVQEDGHKVLIVQASAYTKYVGDITLYFDDEGIVQHWEGAPHFLGNDVTPDAEVMQALQPWKEIVDLSGKRVVGSLKFMASSSGCYQRECLMGTLQAESMLHSLIESDDQGWAYATMAMTNAGGVRGPLSPGLLTYSDLVTTTPFENTVDTLEVQGRYIKEALENAVRFNDSTSLLQTAGMKIVYNLGNAAYARIVTLEVLCRVCDVPKFEAIESDTWYRLAINGFLLVNGDNYAMIRDNARNHKIGAIDIDALTKYVEDNSPINLITPRGRMTIIQ
ncbi:CLUMA_CG003109, isoform A, partial [Clunio marinus]